MSMIAALGAVDLGGRSAMTVIYPAVFGLFAGLELALIGRSYERSSSTARMVVNFGLPLALLPFALLIPVGVTSSSLWASSQHVGLFNQITASWIVILLAAIFCRTGLAYLVHRLSHSIPILWRFHKVHHSDQGFDVSLGLRHHPVEVLPTVMTFSAGTVILGLPLWAATLAETAMIAASFAEHLNVRLSPRLSRAVRWLIVTPDVHRVHHSSRQAQTDSNFGALFTFWDRCFGTYRDPDRELVADLGLEDVDAELSEKLLGQLLLPFTRPAVDLGRGSPDVERRPRQGIGGGTGS